jgi:hypothetical protein
MNASSSNCEIVNQIKNENRGMNRLEQNYQDGFAPRGKGRQQIYSTSGYDAIFKIAHMPHSFCELRLMRM